MAAATSILPSEGKADLPRQQRNSHCQFQVAYGAKGSVRGDRPPHGQSLSQQLQKTVAGSLDEDPTTLLARVMGIEHYYCEINGRVRELKGDRLQIRPRIQ